MDHRLEEEQRLFKVASNQKALLADAAEAALRLNTEPDALARSLSNIRAPLADIDHETAETLLRLKHMLQLASGELGEARHAILALRSSWSWRAMAPLRALLDAVRMTLLLVRLDGRGVWRKRRISGLAQWVIFHHSIRDSGLFDELYYVGSNAHESPLRINPLLHFFVYGPEEARKPNGLFDTRYYQDNNADVARSLVHPLVHYLKWGAYEGRDPHPQFDSSYYLERNPDVRKAHLNPLAHFLAPGIVQGRNPNEWFNTSDYLQQNPGVAALGLNPLVHHLERNSHVFGRDSDL